MSKKFTLKELNKTNITLKDLRDLASELGFELFYYSNAAQANIRVTAGEFDPKRKMGLMRDNKVFIKPVRIGTLYGKMARAINRNKKIKERG